MREEEILKIVFDGKEYIVLFGKSKVYPIGGMLTEYSRFDIRELKKWIMEFKNMNKALDTDVFFDFIEALPKIIEPEYGFLTASIVTAELFYAAGDALHMSEEELKKVWDDFDDEKYKNIKDYVFDETPYTGPGKSTTEQLFLTVCLPIIVYNIYFRYFLRILIEVDDVENRSEGFSSLMNLYSELSSVLDIGYEIIILKDGFHSVYSIHTSLALFAFEFYHCLTNNVNIKKCMNCGNYFVPEGRCDTLYCNWPSPQDKKRTCREIGVQVARANKGKKDIVTREYRKKYMKYKMLTKRHPENRESSKQFSILQNEIKDWRGWLKDGVKNTSQFLEWLNNF